MRQLNKNEEEVVNKLWVLQSQFKETHAYATTTEPITLKEWNGIHPVDENTKQYQIPTGTTLKIVMISRFGEFGLTDKLEAVNGYNVRIPINSDKLKDIRMVI